MSLRLRRRLLASAMALLFGSAAMSPALARHSQEVQKKEAQRDKLPLREQLDSFWSFLDLQCRDPDRFGEDPQARKKQAQHCCDALPSWLTQIERFHEKLPLDESARNALRSGFMQLFECSAALNQRAQAEDALAFVSAVAELSPEERSRFEALELTELSSELSESIARRPKGRIKVRCTQDCNLWINWVARIDVRQQAEGAVHSLELPFGRYIVALEDASEKSNTRSVVRTVTVGENSADTTIMLPNGKPLGPSIVQPVSSPEKKPFPVVSPIVPRPITQSGLGIGLLGVASGSALLALDGYCKKDGISCRPQDRLETRLAGGVVLGIGMTLFVSTIAVLIAERVRGKREFSKKNRALEPTPPVALRAGFAR